MVSGPTVFLFGYVFVCVFVFATQYISYTMCTVVILQPSTKVFAKRPHFFFFG